MPREGTTVICEEDCNNKYYNGTCSLNVIHIVKTTIEDWYETIECKERDES